LEIIIGSLAGGMEIEEIVKEYDLQKEDVLAALAYAARVIAGEEITAYAQALISTRCRYAQIER
jgi:uncharacterized protein (DUF433 family)